MNTMLLEVNNVKLIRANRAEHHKIDEFLRNNQQIKKCSLIEFGYIVETNHKVTGCFTLEPVEGDIYWLKQLYITRTEAIKLPILFESILAIAVNIGAKKVFVRSHKLMLDLILESLQFQLENIGPIEEPNIDDSSHKWWSYQII